MDLNMLKAVRTLKNLDVYGHKVGVRYRGNETYTTILGGLCSILTLVLVVINTANLISDFTQKTAQTDFYQRLKVVTEGMEPFNLQESGIEIVLKAREAHDIPP